MESQLNQSDESESKISHTDSKGEEDHERDSAPRSGDCSSGSVKKTSTNNPQGRPKRSPLLRFYRNLQRKAVVDPLALLALIVALAPMTVSLFWLFVPAKSVITPIEYFTLKTEVYPLPNNAQATVLRLTAAFSFENTHPKDRVLIENISAILKVGNHQSNFVWSQFINSYEDPSQPSNLKFTHLATAGKFSVQMSDTITKEVYFAPMPGTKSQPLANSLVKSKFEEAVAKGHIPCIAFTFHEKENVQRMFYKSENATPLPDYLNNKGWVVSKWKAARSCS